MIDRRPTVVQIVRRYGPVGGMERYVWHLAQGLADAGERVLVICRAPTLAPAHPGITIHAIEGIPTRPGWLSHLLFGRQVTRILRSHDLRDAVVHSHERSMLHDVTTVHSELFDGGDPPGIAAWLSPRHAAQRWLERRELGAGGARAVRIVPVSRAIGRRIAQVYPEVADRITTPIAPALGAQPAPRAAHVAPRDGGVLGFVGHEWRRKGLPKFLEIARQLRTTRPALQVVVVGPDAAEAGRLCQAAGVPATCPGWVDSAAWYSRMDLLVHPAESEAYGMVVPEAMAAGVPVVLSDRCGAGDDVDGGAGSILPLDAPIPAWTAACERWLAHGGIEPHKPRRWSEVVHAYQQVYAQVRCARSERQAPLTA